MTEETKNCPYCAEEIKADAVKCKHCGSMLSMPPSAPYDTLDLPPVGTPAAANRVLSGRYSIVKELGRGGMGVVYLAHDKALDMDVAVKFLPVELSNDRRALEQLHSEAKLSMTLAHPNIMRLHTLDTSGQFKFLVMEYVDGPDMLDVLRERERLPLQEALPIIKGVCEGLDYAHSKRVLHRDLKPENIMLTSKGQVKITDFGIARKMRESMTRLSQKTISGTPAYMAPEHIMGEHITVRSDIYSLGAVTYELLAGHPPFHKGDILAQIRFKKPPLIPGIANEVNTAIMNALAKDADNRPACAKTFYESLLALPDRPKIQPVLIGSAPPEGVAKPPPARKKKSFAALIAAILICLGVVIGALAYYNSQGSEPYRKHPTGDRGKSGESLIKPSPKETQSEKEARKQADAERRARQEQELKLREAEIAAQEARKQAEAERAAREREERKRREAQSMAEEILSKTEAAAQEMLTKAQEAILQKRYSDGIILLEQALAIKDTKETAERLRRARALKEKHDSANKLLAEARGALDMNDRKKALKLVLEALQLDPDNRLARKLEKQSTQPPAKFTNSIGMKFVLIPAGEFMIGSPESEKNRDSDEGPQHRVKITKPFYMQTTEVTQAQWKAVIGNNPSSYKGDNLPVDNVNWNDAQEFLKRLSTKEGAKYCLPTEAEWEYACHAGSVSRFCFGDDEGRLGEYAWCLENSGNKMHPVGSKKPNAWGLYDMHGNVWEWCQDWYDSNHYGKSPVENPQGPPTGEYRVSRGGAWYDLARNCRSAYRYRLKPTDRDYHVGFRASRSSR